MLDIDKCKKEILSGKFSVSLDSRLIKPGEYFIAIKGENEAEEVSQNECYSNTLVL